MENKKPRRKLSSQFKAQLVLEYIKGVKSQAEICRENVINPSLFAKWCRQFEQNAHKVFDDPRSNNSQAEQIAKLERIIGKQAIEIDFLKEASILISMSDKGNPYQNNITESFFKTLKYNEIYLNEYDSFEEAYHNIENFIEIVYQRKRLHSSLGYLPPAEFEEKFLREQQKQLFLESQPKTEVLGCPRTSPSEPRRCLIPLSREKI